jgi:hypothetical protein
MMRSCERPWRGWRAVSAARSLFPVYERLVERFGADLGDERDVLLSKAAVLMFLQEAAGDTERPADG